MRLFYRFWSDCVSLHIHQLIVPSRSEPVCYRSHVKSDYIQFKEPLSESHNRKCVLFSQMDVVVNYNSWLKHDHFDAPGYPMHP